MAIYASHSSQRLKDVLRRHSEAGTRWALSVFIILTEFTVFVSLKVGDQ